MHLSHLVGRILHNFPVVSDKTVGFRLDVRRLRVNAAGEALVRAAGEVVHDLGVSLEGVLNVGVGAVAPLLLGIPEVAFHEEAKSAEFAHDRQPVVVFGRRQRGGVLVTVFHVAAVVVRPAGGLADKAGGVDLLEPLGRLGGFLLVGLAPAFVIGDPDDDTWEVSQVFDHLDQFGAVDVVFLLRLLAAGDHVLPDWEAGLVAEVVVAPRLDLDVLAHEVVAVLL